MIRANFSRSGERLSLTVEGHADYSRGDDIICAAVSGLVYALAGYIVNECKGASVNALRPGYAFLECGTDGEAAMRMAYVGLLQLALTYPGFIYVDSDAWRVRIGKARDVVA